MNTQFFLRLLAIMGVALLLLFPAGAVPTVHAAVVSVHGTVYNQVLQIPASNVLVKLYYGPYFGSEPSYATYTGADGSFHFNNISLPNGEHLVGAYSPEAGYIGTGVGVRITNETTEVNNVRLSLKKYLAQYTPPDGSNVEVPHPELCWESIPQAASFVLQIHHVKDEEWVEDETPSVTSNCYTMQAALINGQTYNWSIITTYNDQGDEIALSGNRTFVYRSGPKFQNINMGGLTTLTSWDEMITFNFPAGAFAGEGTIAYEHDLSSPPSDRLSAVKAYTLSSTAPLVPGASYDVSISYTDYDLDRIYPPSLALYYWDTSAEPNHWEKEPTSVVDTTNHLVSASPNHLSRWALMGEAFRVYLPLVRR